MPTESIPLYAGGPPLAERTYLQNLVSSQEFVNRATWEEAGDTSATTWLGRTLQQSRFGSDQDSPLLSAVMARERLRQEGLNFEVPESGMREATYDSMRERQLDKRAHQDALARGPEGFLSGAQQFSISLARQAIDPLNIAAAFIPVVGEGRIAMMLESAGAGVLARAGVRAQVGAIEGAVGTAALEPAMHYFAGQLQEDYTMADSLLNIAFGGILGGGMHVGVGAIRDWRTVKGVPHDTIPHLAEVPAKGEIPERVAQLSPEMRMEIGRIALAQALSGREVDVASSLDLASITQRAIDQERKPGFLKTAEELLTQRQEDRMRTVPGFLQSALDKLALRELDAGERAVQTRIDERIQGETQTQLSGVERVRGNELLARIQSQAPELTAKELADLMDAQKLRAELLGDVGRLKAAAKERDLTVEELKDRISRMQEASVNDLAVYKRAGIPTDMIAQIQAARRHAAEGVHATAKAGQEPDAGIPREALALSEEADRIVSEVKTEDTESAVAMKDAQDAVKEFEAILKAKNSQVDIKTLFAAEDAAIKQAKDDKKIMAALAICRLRAE